FREGGAPSSGVSKWQRGQMLNKFMGVRRGVTHPAMITGQMGGAFIDPVQSENRDGTLQLLEMIERWLIWGDKNILDGSGNEVNYDGLYLQLVADGGKSIIDKRGDPMDFEDLENAGTQLVERGFLLDFSKVMSMWNPFVLGDLAKLKVQAERRILGQDTPDGYRPGVPLLGYKTQRGYIPFEDSVLLDAVPGGKFLTAAEPGVLVTAPSSATGSITSDSTSLLPIGTYYYFASAMDDQGETDTTASSAQSVTATGKKNTVTITRVTNAVSYRLYRGTKSDGSDAGWIATIPQPSSGDASYVDKDQQMPNTG